MFGASGVGADFLPGDSADQADIRANWRYAIALWLYSLFQ
jgi:hypothetical protein